MEGTAEVREGERRGKQLSGKRGRLTAIKNGIPTRKRGDKKAHQGGIGVLGGRVVDG